MEIIHHVITVFQCLLLLQFYMFGHPIEIQLLYNINMQFRLKIAIIAIFYKNSIQSVSADCWKMSLIGDCLRYVRYISHVGNFIQFIWLHYIVGSIYIMWKNWLGTWNKLQSFFHSVDWLHGWFDAITNFSSLPWSSIY
jgi:hypothetical protein